MIGAHGIADEIGFHSSMEDAVLHALDHHYPSPEGATTERTDAAGPIPQQDHRRQCRPPRPGAK
ncbi:hypothetical protein [Nocardiopsis sp. JB363]|uniref:hypothetical protein n=1 Tax=Nocardiopsis sp. JB363 TaxID=1434837 RepID=UPI00097A2DA2|nr:hypothetical protein [Nocardiopsis sp. JB363]SIO86971.1 hypothetical protein BQ8420_14525 [Nocardiopsis sp. JB363]